jgi:hypothetical protein
MPKLQIILGEIHSRVENLSYKHHIHDYSSEILMPFTDWRPQAAAWLARPLDWPWDHQWL